MKEKEKEDESTYIPNCSERMKIEETATRE
jgi:hypothetical protein